MRHVRQGQVWGGVQKRSQSMSRSSDVSSQPASVDALGIFFASICGFGSNEKRHFRDPSDL
eukprot:scaffold129982_cov63-Phaeocystis_antarctica.AAC.3